MLTPADVEKKVLEAHMDEVRAAEEQIDRLLVSGWEERDKGIIANFHPPLHRLVLDELAKKYRGAGKWDVQLRSSKNTTVYDSLQFKPYAKPVHTEL